MNLPISVVILARNSGHHVTELIPHLDQHFAEVILVDDGSTDATASLASGAGWLVVDGREASTFAAKRETGIRAANQPWILMMDTDERLTGEFISIIRKLIRQPETAGYEVGFNTFFAGRQLRFGGVSPLWVTRLFRRDRYVGFVGEVHERVIVDGPVSRCPLRLDHYSYESTSHYLTKINRYTSDEAFELREARVSFLPPLMAWIRAAVSAIRIGRRNGWSQSAMRNDLKKNLRNRYVAQTLLPAYPLSRFVNLYLFRGGILDGGPGLRYAALSACYSCIKYIKFFEQRQNRADYRHD